MNVFFAISTIQLPLERKSRKSRGKGISALYRCVWLTVCFLQSLCVQAAPSVHGQIHQAVEDFLNKAIMNEAKNQQWKGLRFDQKLILGNLEHLKVCQRPLKVSKTGPLRSGRMRLQINCPDQTGWRRTIKIDVDLWLSVVVAKQLLERGQTIGPEHLAIHEVNVQKLRRGHYQEKNQLIGKSVKRRMRNGQVLTPNLIDQPILIRRGEHIEVVAKNAFFNVVISAQATEDGSLDEVIRVRNLSSGKALDARVKGIGFAESTL